MNPESLDVGDAILTMRTARNMSGRDLARATGFTNGYISLLETNQRSGPVETLRILSNALEVDPWFLLLIAEPKQAAHRKRLCSIWVEHGRSVALKEAMLN